MLRTKKSYQEFWTSRKQFTSQLAAVSFMTYIMSIGQRFPHRLMISRSGTLWPTDLFVGKSYFR